MAKILTVNEGFQGLSLTEWHQRYTQQGKWTEQIRQYLFAKAHLDLKDKILEVGSGTGAILDLLFEGNFKNLFGIDINYTSLAFAQDRTADYHLTQADGYRLPFPDNTFSLVYCHYLLLWLENPTAMLIEMARVTKSDGFVLALAEPDHEARIDYPPPLDALGGLQTQALAKQGVDVQFGRKLGGFFQAAGLTDLETGILGAQWSTEMTNEVDKTEWRTLQSDLARKLTAEHLSDYRDVEVRARKQGNRVLFIPTFYTKGQVNKP